MSKKLWLSGVAFAGLVVGSIATGSSLVAADNTVGTTNTTVAVTGGTIDLAVPDTLTFPSEPVEGIVRGNVNETVNPADNSLLTINDFRGTDAGYTVSAKASAITAANGDVLPGAAIELTPDAPAVTNADAPTWSKAVTLTDSDQPLFATTKSLNGAGISSYDLNKTTLAIPEDNAVKAESYTGVITFTLTPGQPAAPATAQ